MTRSMTSHFLPKRYMLIESRSSPQCKRLKLKCDRRIPCSSCLKRDTVQRCIYTQAAAEKMSVYSVSYPPQSLIYVRYYPPPAQPSSTYRHHWYCGDCGGKVISSPYTTACSSLRVIWPSCLPCPPPHLLHSLRSRFPTQRPHRPNHTLALPRRQGVHLRRSEFKPNLRVVSVPAMIVLSSSLAALVAQ